VKNYVNEKLAENSRAARGGMLAGLEKIRAKYSARIGAVQGTRLRRRHALRSEGNDRAGSRSGL